jgi:hypothetical protein
MLCNRAGSGAGKNIARAVCVLMARWRPLAVLRDAAWLTPARGRACWREQGGFVT